MNLIVDGNSLLHRAHWVATNQRMVTSSGEDVGDIFIFFRSLKSYAKQFNTKNIYVAWDKKLLWPSTNFRKEAVQVEYKGHRDKEKTASVLNNESVIEEMLAALGAKNFFPRVMEADDVISWLSKKLDGPNFVVSADHDLLQLIDEKTSVYNPLKKTIYDLNNFEELMEMPLDCFLSYKAAMGDMSDNIPGIPGYGKVKSKRLALQLETGLDSLNDDQRAIFDRNWKLMNLDIGFKMAGEEEVRCYEDQFRDNLDIEPDLDRFKEYCEQYEFGQFLKKFHEWENLFNGSRLLSVLNSLLS